MNIDQSALCCISMDSSRQALQTNEKLFKLVLLMDLSREASQTNRKHFFQISDFFFFLFKLTTIF